MSLTPKILSLAVMMAIGGTAAAASNPTATSHALGLIKANSAAMKVSADDRFVVRDSHQSGKLTVNRVDRTYRGLPVFEGDMVMLVAQDGSLKDVTMTQRSVIRLDTRPSLSRSEAIFAAGVQFGSDFTGTPRAELVVYARSAVPQLAYKVRLANEQRDMTYFVAARRGAPILLSFSNNHSATATGTAKTMYSGNVSINTNTLTVGGFELRDPSRGNGYTISGSNGRTSGTTYQDADNTWGNNTNTDLATAAVDAHYGVAMTWDYFKLKLGRSGIAGDGKGVYSRVHYGRAYSNAYWSESCFCMTFGDGDGVNIGPLVTLDIAGHEMTHGVMNRTADLTYSGESGGLNEANSDIIGTMVEFYANSAVDVPDYLIGEELYVVNTPGSSTLRALRYMFNPFKDNRSPNCYTSTLGSIDVH